MSATSLIVRKSDGTTHTIVTPEPAVLSLSALAGSGADPLSVIRAALASGARIVLTAEAREVLARDHPEALGLLEKGTL